MKRNTVSLSLSLEPIRSRGSFRAVKRDYRREFTARDSSPEEYRNIGYLDSSAILKLKLLYNPICGKISRAADDDRHYY